jgi:hypothetical protein
MAEACDPACSRRPALVPDTDSDQNFDSGGLLDHWQVRQRLCGRNLNLRPQQTAARPRRRGDRRVMGSTRGWGAASEDHDQFDSDPSQS